jgi:TolB protein
LINFPFSIIVLFALLFSSNQGYAAEHEPIAKSDALTFSGLVGDSWQLFVSDTPIGRPRQLTQLSIDCHYPAWSPDRRRIVFNSAGGTIWLMALNGSTQSLSNLPDNCRHPCWSPSGRRIVFAAYTFDNRIEDSDLWIYDIDSRQAEKLLVQAGVQSYPSWSPDGRLILYSTGQRINKTKIVEDLWVYNVNSGKPVRIISNDGSNIQAAWSPDGARFAFASNLSGNMDIWVADKNGAHLFQVTHSPHSDSDPAWSADGQSICFTSTRNQKPQLWAIDLRTRKIINVIGQDNNLLELMQPALSH